MKWITFKLLLTTRIYHGTPGDRNSSDGLDLTHCCPVVIRDTVFRCHPDQKTLNDFEYFRSALSDIKLAMHQLGLIFHL